eukprot:63404_1
MGAITNIKTNPNNLLGAYSIKLFCGFCIFSNYGNNILLGLQNINDTLNELNNHTFLDKTLYNIVSSNIFWKYYQREFVTNVVKFSVSVRLFVKTIIDYSNYNHNIPIRKRSRASSNSIDNINLDSNDEKMSEVDLDEYNIYDTENEDIDTNIKHGFGDVINKLFPIVYIDKDKDNIQNKSLLEWKLWCPNIFAGKYFGGNYGKEYVIVDFLYYIYPMIFDKNNYKYCQIFMEIYNNELGEYLCSDKITYYVKQCIKDTYCEINNGLRNQSYISLSLAMYKKIEYYKKDYIKNEIVIRAWSKIYDKIFISKYCSFASIIFDRVDESVILRFCYIVKNQRLNNKLLSLQTVCIKGVAMKLSTLNVLFVTLNSMCNELETLILDSLIIRYKLIQNVNKETEINEQEEKKEKEIDDNELDNELTIATENINIFDEILCLQYLPQSITNFIYKNIIHKLINCDKYENKQFLDVIFDANMDDNTNMKELTCATFSNTIISKNNMNVLFCDFISKQCCKLQSISFKDCQLKDDSLEIVKTFYTNNVKHKLNLLDFTVNNNDNNNRKYENKITPMGIKQLEDMFENVLKERKDVKIRLNVTTVELSANMGHVYWNAV